MKLQQLASGEDEVRLGGLELLGVGQAEQVDEDVGVGIEVGVVAHRLWRASVRAISSSGSRHS